MRSYFTVLLLVLVSVPAWSAPSADVFGALPALGDIAISPDGSQIAYSMNSNGQRAIRVVSLDGSDKELRVVGLDDDTKVSWIKWVNNEQVLAEIWINEFVGSDRTLITASYIYTLNSKTLKGRVLVRPSTGSVRLNNSDVVDFLYNDPDHILMAMENRPNVLHANATYADVPYVRREDIFKVKVVSGRSSRVVRGKPGVQNWTADLRGEPRVGQGLLLGKNDEVSRTLIVRDANTEEWRSFADYPGLDADADIFGFTGDPNELIVGRYNDKPTLGLYIYDLAKREFTRQLFHSGEYDAGGLVLNGDGSEVIGASYVAESEEVILFGNYQSALQSQREKYPGTNFDYLDQSADGSKVLLRMSSPSDPGAVVLMDPADGKLRQLAKYRPKLVPQELGGVVAAKYKARDGALIPAFVTLPPSVTESGVLKDLPFVVLPHGGPIARDQLDYDNLAQFFATRGYGVLQMNFRGSSGYGAEFESAGRSSWQLMHQDIEDGTRWLIEKGYADPERIGIAGWSFGGYAALMGVINNPDLYQGAISVAGITDIQGMLSDANDFYFGGYFREFFEQGFEDRTQMLANSPVERVEEIHVPVFIGHGTSDRRVRFNQFFHLRDKLQEADAVHTALEFKSDDHYLSNQKNRQELYRGMEAFLKETLGASEHMR